MSTKIYNGTAITAEFTPVTLREFLHEYYNKVKPLVVQEYEKLIVQNCVAFMDEVSVRTSSKFSIKECNELGLDKKVGKHSVSFFDFVLSTMRLIKEAEKSSYRDTVYDFECFVDIYSIRNDFHLAYIFGEKDFYLKTWKEMHNVIDYGYWNNSDPPEDVSDNEWEERKNNWNQYLDSPPSLRMPILNGITLFQVEGNVEDYIPSMDTRIDRFIGQEFYKFYIKEKNIDTKELDYDFFETYAKARKWIKEEGKEFVDIRRKELHEILPEYTDIKKQSVEIEVVE